MSLLIRNQCPEGADLPIDLITREPTFAQMKGEHLLCNRTKRRPTEFAHEQIKQFLVLLLVEFAHFISRATRSKSAAINAPSGRF